MTNISRELPGFYRIENSARWSYAPDTHVVRDEALGARLYTDRAPGAPRCVLLVVDQQRDFCHPEGGLFIGSGAIGDSARIAEFIYQFAMEIDEIVVTLDTHHPYQIFSPEFWIDPAGRSRHQLGVTFDSLAENPTPYTIITLDDIHGDRWLPDPIAVQSNGWGESRSHDPRDRSRDRYEWVVRECEHYCRTLEDLGKPPLMIWPTHCLEGTHGHSLVGVVEEAVLFHSFITGTQPFYVRKGSDPFAESYSAFGPAVSTRHDAGPDMIDAIVGNHSPRAKNLWLMDHLADFERIVVVGEAASHCVAATVDDLISEIPECAARVEVLTDCTSPVQVFASDGLPVADFTNFAAAKFVEWERLGVNVLSLFELEMRG